MQSGRCPADIDISGAKKLWLVVTEGGDGYSCDWADWTEPRLIRADGSELSLTKLKWKSATSGWGEVHINKNCAGQPIVMDKRTYTLGIGTHAPSIIEYELPENFSRLLTKVGPDMGGVDQGCGTSIEFLVYTEQPPANVLDASADPSKFGIEAAKESLNLMTVAEGLEVTAFAAEPMLRNPTAIDVDARGRVWVAEAVNYRSSFKPWGILQPEGDRIVILEDTNKDGSADVSKIFYQDPRMQAPLGVCVLGNRVIVSCSPEVFVLTDTNGDDKADMKEVLFQVGGYDNDHGVHSMVFGPDGKLYFNFGNYGEFLKDKNGNPVKDRDGNEITNKGQPYRHGMAFRCDIDGGNVEVLGHNFRNPYEVCVDSFGTVWQSDNDDDGNRSVRINYMMQHGNYGYTDEMTGAGWSQKRTNMEDETSRRHWHQNDPGVVPNLLITGAGAPTGIVMYEGGLLPERFRNQLIHCDAGPRVVRSYSLKADGAGYKAEINDVLSSSESWFRPSDVCVAPDGSLYVADWNDAGVGGHNMADRDAALIKGRIYRIAPKGMKPSVPSYDLSRTSDCISALQSPNIATRYLAWKKLVEGGTKSVGALKKVWNSKAAPQMRTRALFALANIDRTHIDRYVQQAGTDKNADVRIAGLRFAKDQGLNVIPIVNKLSTDASAQVRRECALALHGIKTSEAALTWAKLAALHDGRDRWYLEALGIGAQGNDDACFSSWMAAVKGNWDTAAGRDIIWRIRTPKAAPYLAKIIGNPATPANERARYFRALDFIEGADKQNALVQLLGVVAK